MIDFFIYTLPQLKKLILKDAIGQTWPVMGLDLSSAFLDRVIFTIKFNLRIANK